MRWRIWHILAIKKKMLSVCWGFVKRNLLAEIQCKSLFCLIHNFHLVSSTERETFYSESNYLALSDQVAQLRYITITWLWLSTFGLKSFIHFVPGAQLDLLVSCFVLHSSCRPHFWTRTFLQVETEWSPPTMSGFFSQSKQWTCD